MPVFNHPYSLGCGLFWSGGGRLFVFICLLLVLSVMFFMEFSMLQFVPISPCPIIGHQ